MVVILQAMPRPLSHKALLLVGLFPILRVAGQSVIIHEVSNGPAGSQEYVELLVVPTTPVEPCTPVNCLDLRGWILDDNNGFHGGNGVAQGAVRFADHPLWSCVPVGTLITIYNAEDINPSMPTTDQDLGDGNCSLVIASSDLVHLEYSDITPAAVLCNDPGGWGLDPTPTWQSNLALANTGDCVRISDATGCTVFSFCYGNTNTNATVHFPGNGGDQVWSFVNGDPTNAADWMQGCAGDIAACGEDDQTPGSPNSAANATWMATFNNGCAPVVAEDPLEVTAEATTACGCTGSATAEASGSTGPYDFTWYDADWTNTGQLNPSATDLCAGTYHVVAISATGCSDTATVVLPGGPAQDPGQDATVSFCSDDGATDLFEALGGSPDVGGQWTPVLPGGAFFDPATDTPGTYTYTVQAAPGCPPAEAVVTVSVGAIPQVMVDVSDALCSGATDGSIALSFEPAGTYTVIWSGGLPDGPSQNGLGAGSWDVQVSSTADCVVDLSVTVDEPDALAVIVNDEPAQCGNADGSACVEVEGGSVPYAIVWDDPDGQQGTCATDLATGSYSATITDANGCILSSDVVISNEASDFTVTSVVSDVTCAGDADGAISLTMDPPGDYIVDWEGPEGYAAMGPMIDGLIAGGYAYVVTDLLGCNVNGDELVDAPAELELDLMADASSCAGICDGMVVPIISGGTQPWSYLVDQGPVALPIDALCAGQHDLTVIDAQGCSITLAFEVEEGPAGIIPTLSGPETMCLDDIPVLLDATPAGGSWSGNGVDGQGMFDPGVAGVGPHLISYSMPCAAPAEWTVEVVPMPVARFTLPEDGDVVENTSSSASIFQWYVDGLPAGDALDLTLPTAPTTGEDLELSICLAAANSLGCADSSCSIYTYPSAVAVHVPNAFTPNGDQYNDRFAVHWAGPEPNAFVLQIFDRWGHVVFTANARESSWDGTTAGQAVPIGVYPWRLQASVLKEPIIMNGHVTLVR